MQPGPDAYTRRLNAATRRRELRERAVARKGGRCVICHYDRCQSAMDFHHIDSTTKDFNISSRMTWEAIVRELDKCVLLCSRCHREVHDGLHPRYLADPDADRGCVEEGDEALQDLSTTCVRAQ